MTRCLQVHYVFPDTDAPPATPQTVPARENHRSWRQANAARLRRGRTKAVAMLTMKLNRVAARGIAAAFATTPGAVYVRLHRLRSGYYGT